VLILSRKENEGIVIGDGITVRVMGIEDGRVRLGIEAPREVSIHREEIFAEIKKENMEAAKANSEMADALALLKKL